MTPDTPKPPAPVNDSVFCGIETRRDGDQVVGYCGLLRGHSGAHSGFYSKPGLFEPAPAPASAETLEHAEKLEGLADRFAQGGGEAGFHEVGLIIHDSTIEAIRAGADALRHLQSTEQHLDKLQSIVDDMYAVCTLTPAAIAHRFGESRCTTDTNRVNYMTELLTDFVSPTRDLEQEKGTR